MKNYFCLFSVYVVAVILSIDFVQNINYIILHKNSNIFSNIKETNKELSIQPGDTKEDSKSWGRLLPAPVGKAAKTCLVSSTSVIAVKTSI